MKLPTEAEPIMSIDLLDAPLRVTWELYTEETPLSTKNALRVADALAAAGVFFVTLEERPLLHRGFGEVVQALISEGCQVQVLCEGTEQELLALKPALPLAALWLNVGDLVTAGGVDRAGLDRLLEQVRKSGYDPALLLVPNRNNLLKIPEFLELCRSRGVGRIKLPNTKIDDSFCPFAAERLIRPQDLESLRLKLGENPSACRQGLSLEVHDLFLWELFFPGGGEGRSEYGGCQAGNSLAHVDRLGELYPCSSWPVKLGSLLDQDLEDLWQTEERFAVRRQIAAIPVGCEGCRDYSLCMGGCRGLGRTLNQPGGGRDPLCPGPRRLSDNP